MARGKMASVVFGMAVSIASLAAFATLAASATARSTDVFVDERSGATVDWRRGAIVATGGAAPDHRMPSADVARPGAERRAQAAARARIAEVLRALPLGGSRRLDAAAVARAVRRARSTSVEYQSNGGALVRMEISFGDWAEPPPSGRAPDAGASASASASAVSADAAPVPLWLPEGRLAAAPLVLVGGKEISLGGVRYAPAAGLPAGVQPVQVRADKQGRLLVDEGGRRQELAGRPAVIYVQKILR